MTRILAPVARESRGDTGAHEATLLTAHSVQSRQPLNRPRKHDEASKHPCTHLAALTETELMLTTRSEFNIPAVSDKDEIALSVFNLGTP